MVRSLGVMAVVVAITLIFVPGLLHPSKSQRFQPVRYSDYVDGFRQVTTLSAYVPVGLGSGWYANSANLTRRDGTAHLHLGFVAPNDKYLAIEESNGTANGFIRDVVGASGGRVLGQVVINGVSWVRSLSEKGETTLAHTTGGVTVVITGSGTLPQQQELAAALRRA